MSAVPADLLYSAEHEWVLGDVEPGSVVTIGITDHAATALGDVVFVELPSVGDAVKAGEVCGELESSKAVSELYSPVTGTVTAINDALTSSPDVINDEPYEGGWIFKVEVSQDIELLDADAYADHIA
jgi:glycine cleavage system H protein